MPGCSRKLVSVRFPVVTVLAGGYARRVEDTVQIHVNTILAARATPQRNILAQKSAGTRRVPLWTQAESPQ